MSTARDIPVVSIVGKGDSGKTTFLEKLIRELSSRGVRVATVKHHVHDYDIDTPGKDSWRHARAGAVTTMVSSPEKFSVVQSVDDEMSLQCIAVIARNTGADILLTEGYKREGVNRIEISRAARSDELISAPGECIALVTDRPNATCGDASVFALDDAAGVADLISSMFLSETHEVASETGGEGPARSSAGAEGDEDCLSTGPLLPGSDADSTTNSKSNQEEAHGN